jgi:hypothetical protein
VSGRVLLELDFARAFVAIEVPDIALLATLREAFKSLIKSTPFSPET